MFTKYSRTRFLWQVVFAFPFVVANILEALTTIPLFIYLFIYLITYYLFIYLFQHFVYV